MAIFWRSECHFCAAEGIGLGAGQGLPLISEEQVNGGSGLGPGSPLERGQCRPSRSVWMAFDAAVWSWVRATRVARGALGWLVPAALLGAGCQGEIGGDAALPAQITMTDAGVPVSPNQPCPVGQSLCDDRCVDTATDAAHCGTCGTACGAGSVCEASACHALCAQSETLCGAACVSTESDPNHCGTCDQRVPDRPVLQRRCLLRDLRAPAL